MINNPSLDAMISEEIMHEILASLGPRALVIAALRWSGMRDTDIAAELDIPRNLVSARINWAKKRLIKQRPDLAHLIEGRKMRHLMERPD